MTLVRELPEKVAQIVRMIDGGGPFGLSRSEVEEIDALDDLVTSLDQLTSEEVRAVMAATGGDTIARSDAIQVQLHAASERPPSVSIGFVCPTDESFVAAIADKPESNCTVWDQGGSEFSFAAVILETVTRCQDLLGFHSSIRKHGFQNCTVTIEEIARKRKIIRGLTGSTNDRNVISEGSQLQTQCKSNLPVVVEPGNSEISGGPIAVYVKEKERRELAS